jgi:hypothetical protein
MWIDAVYGLLPIGRVLQVDKHNVKRFKGSVPLPLGLATYCTSAKFFNQDVVETCLVSYPRGNGLIEARDKPVPKRIFLESVTMSTAFHLSQRAA